MMERVPQCNSVSHCAQLYSVYQTLDIHPILVSRIHSVLVWIEKYRMIPDMFNPPVSADLVWLFGLHQSWIDIVQISRSKLSQTGKRTVRKKRFINVCKCYLLQLVISHILHLHYFSHSHTCTYQS